MPDGVGLSAERRGDPPRALVVCIGNELVADDAAGVLVHARLMQEQLPSSVTLLCLGLGGIRLLDDLDGQDLLVLCDAVRFGAPVGTVHPIEWLDRPYTPAPAVSAHGIGFEEVLAITRALFPEKLPRRALMVGIEGACFDVVGPPTPAVLEAVERAAAVVLAALGMVPSPD